MKRTTIAKLILIASLVIIAALASVAWFLHSKVNESQNQNDVLTPTPAQPSTPTPVPTPIANITLSPNNQVIFLNAYPSLSLTITQNENNSLQFPCLVYKYCSNFPYQAISYFQPSNYGTYTLGNFYSDLGAVLPSSKAMTVSYYVVVYDSNGTKIESNTVTVEYIKCARARAWQ
jgi:hypothetical protein